MWEQRQEELRQARRRRGELDREAASIDVVLQKLLAVRRAREARLSPELYRLRRQVEKLLARARTALHYTDSVRTVLQRLRGHGHGDLVDATPALIDALHQENSARGRLTGFLAEHLPQAAPSGHGDNEDHVQAVCDDADQGGS